METGNTKQPTLIRTTGKEPKSLLDAFMEACRCAIPETEEEAQRKEIGMFVGRKGFNWKTLAQIMTFYPNRGDGSRTEKFLYGLVKMGVLFPKNNFLGTGYLVYFVEEGRKISLLRITGIYNELLFQSQKDAAVFASQFKKINKKSHIGVDEITRKEVETNNEEQGENWLNKTRRQSIMSLEKFI